MNARNLIQIWAIAVMQLMAPCTILADGYDEYKQKMSVHPSLQMTLVDSMHGGRIAGPGKDCKILSQSEGSITFEVDEDLEILDLPYFSYKDAPKVCIKGTLQRFQIPESEFNVVAHSLEGELMLFGSDAFYRTLVYAYAYHQPMVISPDMIWLLISQSFGEHVSLNAEQLRSQIVNHEGEMTIRVKSPSNKNLLNEKDVDWDKLFNQFEKQIADNTKGDIAKTLISDFSTTGRTERIVSQVTLMNATKPYFKYEVVGFICGIPSITLQGTAEDWQKVLDKTRALEKYGISWWTKQLEPILQEFVNAAKGHPNSKFWKDIVMEDRPDRIRGMGCLQDGKSTEFDGWFLKLFPNMEKKTVLEKTTFNDRTKSELVKVPFKFVLEDLQGNEIKKYDMEIIAGIIGVEKDEKTSPMIPKMGWIVRKVDAEAEKIARITEIANTHYKVLPAEKVLPLLQKVKHLKQLKITFEGKVELPRWMDDMQIDVFMIHNDISKEDEAALKKRFPNLQVIKGSLRPEDILQME